MNLALTHHDVRNRFAGLPLAAVTGLVAAALLVFLATDSNMKVIAATVGGLGLILAALISGNPRLFCVWGLMFALPFDLSKRFGQVFLKMGGESSFRVEFSDVFLLALLLCIAWDVWSGRLPGIRIPKVTYFWLLLMLLGCGWVLFGYWRLTAAHEVFRMGKVTILFLVICNELNRPRRILQCTAALSFGVVVQAVVGLIQYFTNAHLGLELLGETGEIADKILAANSVRGETVHRVGAFLSHPNVFGAFLAGLLPLAIAGFLLRIGIVSKLFFLLTSILGTAALIVTLSRSGWLSFAVAFVLLMSLMMLHPGLRRRSIMAASVAGLALLLVMVFFAGSIISRIFNSDPAAMLGRQEFKNDAWGMISAKPIFGFGLNSYVLAVPRFTKYGARGANAHYSGWIPPVHNIYLLWWSETGIVGLIIFLLTWAAIIWMGIGNLRVRNEMLFAINAACLSSMAAFVTDGFFSFSLRFNSILRVFWVIAGIILAVYYCRLHEAAEQSRQRAPDSQTPAQSSSPDLGGGGTHWTPAHL